VNKVALKRGYPIPLGIISFDSEVVGKAQAGLSKILETSLAIPYHCDWGAEDMVSSVQAALQAEVGKR
jgi:hypothetical protein